LSICFSSKPLLRLLLATVEATVCTKLVNRWKEGGRGTGGSMEEREVEKWDETNVEMNFFLFLSKKTQTKQIQVDFVDTELLFFLSF